MKRVLASIAVALVVCFMSWAAGFDFNERGLDALMTAYVALCAAGLTYIAWSK